MLWHAGCEECSVKFQTISISREEQMTEQVLNSITSKAVTGSLTLKDAVHEYERIVITEALKEHGEDKRNVAKLLGISLSSLYRKIGEEMPEGIEEKKAQDAQFA
jgi:transcriptional regulator with PAS, ATPase and Fis domain